MSRNNVKGVSYNEYMKEYMKKKRCNNIEPVNALLDSPLIQKTIIKRITIHTYPDYYHYTCHQKKWKKVLKVMIDRVQWLKWTELFDLVIEEFNEKENGYIKYHNLDVDCDVLIVCNS